MFQMQLVSYIALFAFLGASLILIATKRWYFIFSLLLLAFGSILILEVALAKGNVASDYTAEQISIRSCDYDNKKELLILETDRGRYEISGLLISETTPVQDGVTLICRNKIATVWTVEPPPGPKTIRGLETPGILIPLTINDTSSLMYWGIFFVVGGVIIFLLTLFMGKEIFSFMPELPIDY